MSPVKIGSIPVGPEHPPVLIAGPCVLESEDLLLQTGRRIKELAADYHFPFILKSSYEKANRTSGDSYRGPGIIEGMAIFKRVKAELGVPVLTDIHTAEQAVIAASVVDCLQIPAFLCRQTDLIEAAAKTNLPVNIKKGQFVAPKAMEHAAAKVSSCGNGGVILTERGSMFGYSDLIVDMRSLVVMSNSGAPVIFDATHSIQKPGGSKTGGDSSNIMPLVQAAAATGAISGVFLEVHPQPEKALSDAESQLKLDRLEKVLNNMRHIFDAVEQIKRDGGTVR